MREAAEAGVPNAAQFLGVMFLKGLRVEKNPELAVHYNRMAAEAGHPIAADTLYNIALVHREQGRHDLEAECFDKCVVIYGKVHGDADCETVDAREQAARARA